MKATGRAWWPTSCVVCNRWQGRTLCADCHQLSTHPWPRCPRCALRIAPGQELCSDCTHGPPHFDHAVAAMDYISPWSGMIADLKFRQRPAIAGVLAGMLTDRVRARWAEPSGSSPPGRMTRRAAPLRRGAPTVVMPVPLSPSRLRERGYNQAWLLARQVADALHLPSMPDGLVRRRETRRLMSLDADERHQQIKGAFAVHPDQKRRMVGRHVAVVDDVLTTGATLNEVAACLWEAGAREVSVWVVARTPSGQQLRPASRCPD